MIHALIDNALLLLLLCWLLALCKNRWSLEHRHARLLAGLWFGGVCVAGMSLPLELAPGVIFDARSVVLSMAALFGGVLVGGVAALIAATYRLWLGGAGIYAGLASILLPLLFGLAYRRLHRRGLVGLGFAPLLIFGLLLHIAIITLQLLLPRHLALQTLQQVAMPLLGVFSLLTALLGLMLQDMRQRASTLRALRQNEAHLRAVTQSIPDLLVVMSADGRLLQLGLGDTGLEPAQLEGRPLLGEVALDVAGGQVATLMGASGSGKSTLLNLIGCLDHPSSTMALIQASNITKNYRVGDEEVPALKGISFEIGPCSTLAVPYASM